jgi:transcriptional regulator with XRE-family HTH domain
MSYLEQLNDGKRMEMEELVTRLLEDTGHSRVGLAEKLGVSVGAIGRYRRGRSMGTNEQRAILRGLCEECRIQVQPLDYWVRLAGGATAREMIDANSRAHNEAIDGER